jgi:carboxymethylenebutenolidase
MGGGFAFLYAAGVTGNGLRVVAPFYGPVPDEPERSLAGICPVVASFGGRDGAFGRMAAPLERALDGIGVEHDVKVYPDAGHAFMTRTEGVIGWIGRRLPAHVGYDEPSAEDAWARTLAFFGRHLGTPEATG